MTSMTEPTAGRTRINDSIVTAAVTALTVFEPESREQATSMLLFWVRRAEMTEVDLAEILDRMFPGDDLVEPPACPEWCIINHTGDLSSDTVDLVTHQAQPMAYGVAVSRTDCPSEGRIGRPHLYVSIEEEIETWEDAGRLAHAILDGVDFLVGAEKA